MKIMNTCKPTLAQNHAPSPFIRPPYAMATAAACFISHVQNLFSGPLYSETRPEGVLRHSAIFLIIFINITLIFFVNLLHAGDALPAPGAYDQVTFDRALEKGCLSCHEGIEDINAKMTAQNVTCINCHYGNPVGTTKEDAHKGMIANPGDLQWIDKTCGQCHSAKPRFSVKPVEIRGEKGHVDRMVKGIIATAAGEISGTRYVWGAQDTPNALYGVRPVKDEDGVVPAEQGALDELLSIPSAQSSDADNLLRHSCLQCHLWTEGRAEPGYYRGAGCTACHVVYADDGLSTSADPTVSKTRPGHPTKHEIIAAIPTTQCLRCHDGGPARYIGPQFTGKVARDATLTGVWPQKSLSYAGDLHYQNGMDCIDCHSSRTIHGDGNIYSKAEQQVAIRCETCHGTLDQYATITDARGERPYQLFKRGREVYLRTKISNIIRRIPQVAQLREAAALPSAMVIPAHVSELQGRHRLECYSCHSRTVTQCYGCHLKRDDRAEVPADWVQGHEVSEAERAGTWEGSADSIQWSTAVLGVNSRGTVSPFSPGGQLLLTRIARDGAVVALNKTPSKTQPFSFAPVQPHSTTKQARSCESCHNDPKALGLGYGGQGIKGGAIVGPGLEVVPFERWVDEQGNPLQSVAHANARPFTAEEMERVTRTNVCLACHKRMPFPETWKPVTDTFGRAITNQQHKNALERLFQKGTTEDPLEGTQ